jgi:peptidoglycan lytic transglycosylase
MTTFPRPIHAGFTLYRASLATIALLAIGVASCGHRSARAVAPPAPARIGSTEKGVASWYGIPYHGRRAASGELFDMEQLTAAHRTLPFQTWVEVTNLDNGKQVDVRITDRGPFARGRIIDLSQAAARDIDMLRPGTARVQLKIIRPPAVTALPVSTTNPRFTNVNGFVVQAGAFADHSRAESLRIQLEEEFGDARILSGPRNLWRVLVGRQLTLDQATALAVSVRAQSGEAQIVAEPASQDYSEAPTPE